MYVLLPSPSPSPFCSLSNRNESNKRPTQGTSLLILKTPNIQKVTPRESKPRISRTKGHLSKRTAFVREIVKEVAGYVSSVPSPSWKKGGGNDDEKRNEKIED